MNTETKKIEFFASIINTFRTLGNTNDEVSDISEEDVEEILKQDKKAKELLETYNMGTKSELEKHVKDYVNKCEVIKKGMVEKLDLNSMTNSNIAKKMRDKHDKVVKKNNDERELSK